MCVVGTCTPQEEVAYGGAQDCYADWIRGMEEREQADRLSEAFWRADGGTSDTNAYAEWHSSRASRVACQDASFKGMKRLDESVEIHLTREAQLLTILRTRGWTSDALDELLESLKTAASVSSVSSNLMRSNNTTSICCPSKLVGFVLIRLCPLKTSPTLTCLLVQAPYRLIELWSLDK
ncbi:hypothetical protein GQ600_25861 [Phytophthora cactorum]|nr:hypothetical protein GQ600_25861 [Phytophthora cactorum]